MGNCPEGCVQGVRETPGAGHFRKEAANPGVLGREGGWGREEGKGSLRNGGDTYAAAWGLRAETGCDSEGGRQLSAALEPRWGNTGF